MCSPGNKNALFSAGLLAKLTRPVTQQPTCAVAVLDPCVVAGHRARQLIDALHHRPHRPVRKRTGRPAPLCGSRDSVPLWQRPVASLTVPCTDAVCGPVADAIDWARGVVEAGRHEARLTLLC
jgi:hypothetical protein